MCLFRVSMSYLVYQCVYFVYQCVYFVRHEARFSLLIHRSVFRTSTAAPPGDRISGRLAATRTWLMSEILRRRFSIGGYVNPRPESNGASLVALRCFVLEI